MTHRRAGRLSGRGKQLLHIAPPQKKHWPTSATKFWQRHWRRRDSTPVQVVSRDGVSSGDVTFAFGCTGGIQARKIHSRRQRHQKLPEVLRSKLGHLRTSALALPLSQQRNLSALEGTDCSVSFPYFVQDSTFGPIQPPHTACSVQVDRHTGRHSSLLDASYSCSVLSPPCLYGTTGSRRARSPDARGRQCSSPPGAWKGPGVNMRRSAESCLVGTVAY